MTHFSADVLPTGTVRFRTNQGCYLGELPAGISPRVQTLGDLFARVGIVAQVTPHIQSFEWSKYVAWVCLMAPAVLTRLESYKILQDPQMASITAAICHEMAQLATNRGLALLFPVLIYSTAERMRPTA
jgi:ketopantoate reductase